MYNIAHQQMSKTTPGVFFDAALRPCEIPCSLCKCAVYRWMVDLGTVQRVSGITIFQRSDCCSGSLTGFRVYIGIRNTTFADSQNYLCPNPFVDIPANSASVTFSCAASGRYVWVTLPGASRTLSLCQVQVWSNSPFIFRQLSGVAEVRHLHSSVIY
jgi:hypothetical protein